MRGKKTGGRRKGTPNRTTTETRTAFQRLYDGLAPDLEQWIRTTAEEDPGRAAELVLRLAEFVVPKLQRTELSSGSAGAEPLRIEIVRPPDAS